MDELTEAEYQELKKALATPGAVKNDAYKVWATVQTQAYESKRAPQAAAAPPAAGEPGSELAFDDRFDLVPQALALQPATTHPGGDQAAANEWVRSGGKDAKGVVYVYEPPVQIVQQMLLDNPDFIRSLRPNMPPTADEIANLSSSDSLYEDASNQLWRETADAAAKAGKTAYRYSRTPWLHGDGSKGMLGQLKLKLDMARTPIEEGAEAFIMGNDNTAFFGAGRAAQETASPTTLLRKPAEAARTEDDTVTDPMTGQVVGSAPAAPPPEPGPERDTLGIDETVPQPTAGLNAAIREKHPIPYVAGQITGAVPGAVKLAGKGVGYLSKSLGGGIERLAPWSASNAAFDTIAKAAQRGLTALGVTNKVAPVAAGAVSAGVAGAGVQAAQEGVDMGARYLQTGQAPTAERLAEAGERIKDTGLTTGAIGGALQIPQRAAAAVGDWVREGEHYEGLPGRGERLGAEATFGKGFQIPEQAKAAKEAGKKADVGTRDVIAKELAPKVEQGADDIVKGEIHGVGAAQEPFFASPEGQLPLPLTKTVEKGAEVLRRKHQRNPDTGALEPIGIDQKRAAGHILDKATETVSLEPVQGAVPLPLEEALAFLPEEKLASLMPKRAKGGSSGSRELSPEDLEGGGASEGLADNLRRRGVKTVYLVPRKLAAEQHEEAIKEIGELGKGADNPNTRIVGEIKKAAYEDRDARPMKGVQGGWSAFQSAAEKRLRAAKDIERRASPEGGAVAPLVRFAHQRPGEILDVEAIRAAAARGGVGADVDKILRALDPLETLNQWQSFGRVNGTRSSLLNPRAVQDFGVLRYGYPTVKAIEGATGPIGMGKGGRAALAGEEPEDQKRRKQSSERRAPAYTARREAELDRKYPGRKKKREEKQP